MASVNRIAYNNPSKFKNNLNRVLRFSSYHAVNTRSWL